jgi:NAD/NADP transhydrogenase alpha subunit
MLLQTILLMKETRAGELRVGLVPDDVNALVDAGHKVLVESGAGIGAGYEDSDYELAGAAIISDVLNKKLLSTVTIIVRVKRPNIIREEQEFNYLPAGIKMVGALDPIDKHGTHIEGYKANGIHAYSLDAAALPHNHPMNILSSMSKIAGRLAFQDALSKLNSRSLKRVLVIGYGVAGQAVADAAIKHGFAVTVMARHRRQEELVLAQGGQWVVLDPALSVQEHQEIVANHLPSVDIVVTSARQANTKAPLLITESMLLQQSNEIVLVDLALSEGGNIEGSLHDQVIVLPNGIKIINQSGYPKQEMRSASILWSVASRYFVDKMALNQSVGEYDRFRI